MYLDKTKLLSVLMVGVLSSCYANVPINEIPKDNKIEVKIDNKQELKPSVSTSPLVVNTPMPTSIVTKAPIEENDNTKLSSNNINTPQSSPTPIPTFLPTNTQPLPEPSNYGIACTPADFLSLPFNNLNDIYNPESNKYHILESLKYRNFVTINLGFKNLYKIRQLSLLTKKEQDKFKFVSQACFDTTKLNELIKSNNVNTILSFLPDGMSIEEYEKSGKENYVSGENVLSRMSIYELYIIGKPTEDNFNKINSFLLKLREIEALKYISISKSLTVS